MYAKIKFSGNDKLQFECMHLKGQKLEYDDCIEIIEHIKAFCLWMISHFKKNQWFL